MELVDMDNKDTKDVVQERRGPSPVMIFGLCGSLLLGILLGSALLPWMAETIAAARSSSSSVIGEYVETEHMLDENGKFVILDYPADTAGGYVELPELSEIKIEPVEKAVVTDADIASNIESYLIYYNKDTDRTEGIAQIGDRVVINFEASADGEALEGYSAEGAVLQLGSAHEPEGFAEALNGVQIGEEITFQATFPEDWEDEAAGTTADFTATITAVREIPEVTDENVSELTDGEYESVDAFEAYIRASLEDLDEDAYRESVYAEALESITAGATFKPLSKALLEWYTSVQMKYYQTAADEAEMTMGDYLESMNMGDNPDKVANAIAESGTQAIQRYVLLTAIADQVGIEVDPEDASDSELIESRRHELLHGLGLTSEEEVEDYYGLGNIQNDVRNQKTIDWLVENIKQEHVDEPVEETDGTDERS